MALRQGKISVASGATSANLVSGTEFEFLPGNAKVTLSLVGTAAGPTVRWTAGSVVLIEEAEFTFITAGAFPVIPDNILDAELVPAGQRQIVEVTNGTNASVDIYWRMDVDYL